MCIMVMRIGCGVGYFGFVFGFVVYYYVNLVKLLSFVCVSFFNYLVRGMRINLVNI